MEFHGRARNSADLNIAPLIDVVFLLLLFFMLSSAFSNEERIELLLPSSSTSKDLAKNSSEVSILSSGKIMLNQVEVGLEQIESKVRELVADSPDIQLLIRSDAAVDVQRLVTVMDNIRRAGIENISIATNLAASNATINNSKDSRP